MAVFRVKQKTYGLMDGVGNAAKGVVNTTRDVVGTGISSVGKVADSGIGSTAGFLGGLGMMSAGAGVGAKIGSVLGLPGAALGGLAGAIATPFLGKAAVNTGGKILKTVGDEIHT